MSEFLQRFRDRYQIWRDEHEAGPSGPRSGQKPPYRNPLWWGALAGLGVIASGIYDLVAHQHAPQVWTAIRSVAFIVFLVFYVRRSRFAWHTLGVIIVCVIPLEVLLTPIDPGLKFRAPQLIWIHVGFLCWGLLLLLKCRRPYFLFIEAKARHDSA